MILLLAIGCVEYAINTLWSLPSAQTSPYRHSVEWDTSASEDTGNLVDSVTGPIASAPVYANTSGRLYEVEPSTGEAITIGGSRRQWQSRRLCRHRHRSERPHVRRDLRVHLPNRPGHR